jgi:hypothetical protein
VEPVEIRPLFPSLFQRLWLRRGVLVLRTLLVLAYTAYLLNISDQNRRLYLQRDPKAPLHGIWNVDAMEIDGKVRPPLVTDKERWRRVIFDQPGILAVQLMSDSRERYGLLLEKNVMTLRKRDDATWKTSFTYAHPKPGLLTLEGTLDSRKIRATLHREKTPEFQLTTRGFHWINERPFYR